MFREACPPRQSLGTVQRRSFLGNDLARSRPVGSMYRARHVTSSVFPSRLRRCCAAVGRDRARPPHGRAAASPQCDPPRGGRGCTSAGSATPSTDRSPGSPRRSAGRERNCSGPRTPSCISASGKERPARTPDARLSVTSGHSSRSSADRCRARHRTRLSGARLEKHAKATPMGGELGDCPREKKREAGQHGRDHEQLRGRHRLDVRPQERLVDALTPPGPGRTGR